MDLNYVYTELQRLTTLVEGWKTTAEVNALERDLVLARLRDLYEMVRFEETVAPAAHEESPSLVPPMPLPEPEPLEAVPVEMDIPIVYEDSDIVVVNKPRDLVVHPAAGHAQDTLVNALLFACDDLSGIGGKLRPGIVHRLDKDTTGLLVVAKNDE
ncbi:MAG: hypothetical protein IIW59_07875, partial [Alistipes sp.]|nr:hypothetical protein [Alistipes sp.]